MIVTIDNNTRPVELYHLSILFRSLAKAHGFVAPVEARTTASQTQTIGELSVKLDIDTTDATSAVEALADLIDRTGVKVEDVPPVTVTVVPPVDIPKHVQKLMDAELEHASIEPPVTDANLDSSGLPWDARIHAGSRERNTDGSWRVRRRPKDSDQDAWDATIARVTAELTDLMAIPVSPGAVADAAAEEALTDAEVDQLVEILEGIGDIPVATGAGLDAVIEQRDAIVPPPVTVAPPVVVPPVTAVAPPISDKPAIETFAQLMSWLTSRTPKDEAAKPEMVAKVNQILTDNGLTVLQQLNQRPDLIPQIMSQFVEAFGE